MTQLTLRPHTLVDRAVLVYDGECGFCRRWVARWRPRTGDAVEYVPYQEAVERFPGLLPEDCRESVQWFGPYGERARGAEAVFRVLSQSPGQSWLLSLYRAVPPFAAASELAYRFVSARRHAFSRGTDWLWGRDPEPATFRTSAWLFLRLLGLVYLAAFGSLWAQAAGLWGPRGILPAGELLQAAGEHLGSASLLYMPTLFWLSSSDAAFHAVCGAGVLLSALAALGAATGPALLVLWVLYLSLVNAGTLFMNFQWDMLLLEAGFLAFLVAPWRLRPEWDRWSPPAPGLWLVRLLLFRLMFSSGAVKLLSGDPAWRDLSALRLHLLTQPLPTSLSWYAAQLPAGFLRLCCGAALCVELLVPFLIFLPRHPRWAAFLVLAAYQALIALTGNYGFLNALAVVLAVPLLDDSLWARVPRALRPVVEEDPVRPPRSKRWLAPAFAALFLLGVLQLATLAGAPRLTLGPLDQLHLVNHYGLFGLVTPQRLEVVVEGSLDGREWREYAFKFKPDDPRKRPGFVAPHQPRLDWQMYFAALSPCEQNLWFVSFIVRLMEGSEPVLGLLDGDPFGGRPPELLRTSVQRYVPARPGEPGWWVRERLAPYCPRLAARHDII